MYSMNITTVTLSKTCCPTGYEPGAPMTQSEKLSFIIPGSVILYSNDSNFEIGLI